MNFFFSFKENGIQTEIKTSFSVRVEGYMFSVHCKKHTAIYFFAQVIHLLHTNYGGSSTFLYNNPNSVN